MCNKKEQTETVKALLNGILNSAKAISTLESDSKGTLFHNNKPLQKLLVKFYKNPDIAHLTVKGFTYTGQKIEI